jgi:uncharacterized OsmC-like protein
MAAQPDGPQAVTFTVRGRAVGRMRNEMEVAMTEPMVERFAMATDEGPFHGGEATAPPPLAHFAAGLAGCIMTQIRAFARRMDVTVDDLTVDVTARWRWTPRGRLYETAPEGFEIDVTLDSPDPFEAQVALIEAARRGCFVEQTLGRANTVTHRIRRDGALVAI